MKKIGFGTLGCKLNQYESDCLIAKFIENGYKIVTINEFADAYVINTCTVTVKSDSKSRQMIRKSAKINPEALIVATGCYAENNDDVLHKIAKIHYIIDNKKKHYIFDLVNNFFKQQSPNIDTIDAENVKNIKDDSFAYHTALKTLHTRSLIKIQEGCDNFCSYCKIPFVRGKPNSRKLSEILDNVKEVLEAGFKEIVLTGINVGRYQSDSNSFSDLISAILSLSFDFRLHISSLEPNTINEELIELLSHQKICRHLHIPLQSGSNKILHTMNRHYSKEFFCETVQKIKSKIPKINLTTDLIVGFPNESEEDFLASYNLIKETGFSHVHTFPFSLREGTEASKYKDNIPSAVKKQRCEMIRRLSKQLNYEYRKRFAGEKVNVLVEETNSEGFYEGFSQYYFKVAFKTDEPVNQGDIYCVKIEEVEQSKSIAIFQ